MNRTLITNPRLLACGFSDLALFRSSMVVEEMLGSVRRRLVFGGRCLEDGYDRVQNLCVRDLVYVSPPCCGLEMKLIPL
ncbi:unnamed protein product [Arabis nemorensis]|uniref:Uncharacterized protein n=1 Tax=Arabis nemorensis TaxID=586526 RepID=A0A565CM33_9BRAS|nr:unnamed protein product [Arabis nemorensis]